MGVVVGVSGGIVVEVAQAATAGQVGGGAAVFTASAHPADVVIAGRGHGGVAVAVAREAPLTRVGTKVDTRRGEHVIHGHVGVGHTIPQVQLGERVGSVSERVSKVENLSGDRKGGGSGEDPEEIKKDNGRASVWGGLFDGPLTEAGRKL